MIFLYYSSYVAFWEILKKIINYKKHFKKYFAL